MKKDSLPFYLRGKEKNIFVANNMTLIVSYIWT